MDLKHPYGMETMMQLLQLMKTKRHKRNLYVTISHLLKAGLMMNQEKLLSVEEQVLSEGVQKLLEDKSLHSLSSSLEQSGGCLFRYASL